MPTRVVQYLCPRGPEAIDRECTVLHTTTGQAYTLSPLAFAVARPTRSRKTETVRLLLHGSQDYYNDVEMEGERMPFQTVPDPPPVAGVPETNLKHRDTGKKEVRTTRTTATNETRGGALPILPPLTSDHKWTRDPNRRPQRGMAWRPSPGPGRRGTSESFLRRKQQRQRALARTIAVSYIITTHTHENKNKINTK